MKNKGISMISLVITIIVIIILASVAFNSSTDTVSTATYSNYVNNVSEVQEAFNVAVANRRGNEAKNGKMKQVAQVVEAVAIGSEKYKLESIAEKIPYTIISSGDVVADELGIKLPQMKVGTQTAEGVIVKYAVTPEGVVFAWPPIENENKLYSTSEVIAEMTETTGAVTINNKKITVKISKTNGELLPPDEVYLISSNLTNVISDAENNSTIFSGDSITLKYTPEEGYYLPDEVTVFGATIKTPWSIDEYGNGSIEITNPTDDVTITIEATSCFIAGTKILMSDNTLKNIEDIKLGDRVVTFNHENGELDIQEVYLLYEGRNANKFFTLHFTNDINLSIVGEHDLFEQESNGYITINEKNVKSFIGHHFYNVIEGRYEELLNITYSEDDSKYYSIYTKYNFNSIAEGMLTAPDDIDEYLKIYKYDKNLIIDQDVLKEDIQKYGLLEYPDDSLFSEEEFYEGKMQYTNIAVGKGLVTWKDIRRKQNEYVLMDALEGTN